MDSMVVLVRILIPVRVHAHIVILLFLYRIDLVSKMVYLHAVHCKNEKKIRCVRKRRREKKDKIELFIY